MRFSNCTVCSLNNRGAGQAFAAWECWICRRAAADDLEIAAEVDEQERVILALAAGVMRREEFTAWVHSHVVSRRTS